MKKSNKKGAAFLITIMFVVGMFAQVNLISNSLVSSTGGTKNDAGGLNSSDFNENYAPDAPYEMDIDSQGSNTNVTMADGVTSKTAESYFDGQGSPEANTIIDQNKKIKSTMDNKTILNDTDKGVAHIIHNDFNPHKVEINGSGAATMTLAEANDAEDHLEHWDWWVESFFDVQYEFIDAAKDYENLVITDIDSGGIGYVVSRITQPGIAQNVSVNVNGFVTFLIDPETGYIYDDDDPLIPIGEIGSCSYEDLVSGFTCYSVNETVVITDGEYEIIATRSSEMGQNIIDILVRDLTFDIQIYWELSAITKPIISIFFSGMQFIFYLILETELMYVIISVLYDIKIEYYLSYIVIVWYFIEISIIWLDFQIHWIIVFWWEVWFVKIQYWFVYIEFNVWQFTTYNVFIEYTYQYNTYIYLYYVPSVNPPNMLDIDIIKQVFNDTKFEFTVLVTDWSNTPVQGASVDYDWNNGGGTSAGTTDANGEVSFIVDAVLVQPADDPVPLNLTASMQGYSDGHLDVLLKVDPEAVGDSSPSSEEEEEDDEKDKDGDGDDDATLGVPGPSFFLIGLASTLAAVFIALRISKKRREFM